MNRHIKRRFTPEEDDIIRVDWADYIDVRVIAAKLGRDYGTLRQRILILGLRRDRRVIKMLKWCPEHLKEMLKSNGSNAFIYAVNAYEEELSKTAADLDAEATKQMKVKASEIDARPELERKERMMALRAIGMTLQEIGDRYGVTHERVRQITDPAYRYSSSQRVGRPKSNPVDRLLRQKEKVAAKIKRIDASMRAAEIVALRIAWDAADGNVRKEFLGEIKNYAEPQ